MKSSFPTVYIEIILLLIEKYKGLSKEKARNIE
jgi:hypothetical protein